MNNKAKVVIAVICLAIAGVALANNFGLFGGGKPTRQGVTQNTTQTGGTNATDKPAEEPVSPYAKNFVAKSTTATTTASTAARVSALAM